MQSMDVQCFGGPVDGAFRTVPEDCTQLVVIINRADGYAHWIDKPENLQTTYTDDKRYSVHRYDLAALDGPSRLFFRHMGRLVHGQLVAGRITPDADDIKRS